MSEQTIKENNTQTISISKEISSWEELDAKLPLLRGIYSYGFENPSPIQKKAIIPMFEKKYLIAQAQSGTGKT